MKYIVIGLGDYGRVLAEELSALGHEVIGVDTNENRVDAIKDKIATAFVLDATDEQSLKILPLDSVDVVIVAIGDNFGASVRVVALLKQRKVTEIYARAIDEVHKSVLEAFDIRRILTPEYDAAFNLVQLLDFGTSLEAFKVDSDYYVIKFLVPTKLIGYTVNELDIYGDFKIKLLGLIRKEKVTNCLGIGLEEGRVKNELVDNEKIVEGDKFICYGKYKDFQSFWRAF